MSGMDWERAAQRDKVRDRTPADEGYWLTVFKQGTRCSECGNAGRALGGGVVAGYRHRDQHVLCEGCLERYGIAAKPSKRFLRAKR